MSYLAADLHGICGMMPAFATADAGDMTATDTIDVGHLQAGLDRAIKDGVHMFATTGTFVQTNGRRERGYDHR